MSDLEETLIAKEIKTIVEAYNNSKQKPLLDIKLQGLTEKLGTFAKNQCDKCGLCKSEKEIPSTFEIVALIRQAEANREISEKRAQQLLRKVANTDKAELLKLYRGLTEIF